MSARSTQPVHRDVREAGVSMGRRVRRPWLSIAACILLTAACHAGPTTQSGAPTRTSATSAAPAPSVAATSRAATPDAVISDPDSAPCTGAAPAQWKHVLWIWFENKPDVAVLGSPDAPYFNKLATLCGSASNYRAITHPSLPNYIAATSGSTHGIRDDHSPDAHPLGGPNLFGQITDAGLQWRSYQDAQPERCAQTNDGTYAVRHDPATYYTAIRAQCARWDVPLEQLRADLAADALPAFAFITPDRCHDMHDCPVATGDRWLSRLLPTILHSRAYTDGTTAVFVTFDEDDEAHHNRIPLLAIAPSIPAGTTFSKPADHYTLLRTTESMLGLPALGKAASASVLPHF